MDDKWKVTMEEQWGVDVMEWGCEALEKEWDIPDMEGWKVNDEEWIQDDCLMQWGEVLMDWEVVDLSGWESHLSDWEKVWHKEW